MVRIWFVYIILASSAVEPASAQQRFPEWRGSTVLLPAEWIASPIAAVGEVINIAAYGEQGVDRLPAPMSPLVRKLYWCMGDFELAALVKGKPAALPKRYLWASPFPGCRLWPDDPRLVFARFKTRVWLLREEGGFLRPTYDGGAHLFIGLFDKWDEDHDSRIDPARRLGSLLLKPAANSDSLAGVY